MKQIRVQIHDLIEQHGATFTNCSGCSICSEIETLRNRLLQDPADRFAHILQKGEDMTKSDIKFLLDNEVTKRTIQKHLKMGNNVFVTLMTNFGMIKKKPKGESVMAKITKEEYQDLKAKGLTDKAIAKEKEMAASYLSTLKKQWIVGQEKITVNALNSSPQAHGKEREVFESPRKAETDTGELNTLKAELKAVVNGKDSRIEELEGLLQEAKERIEHLTACCDDLEKEIESTSTQPEYISALHERINQLEAELTPIRQLAFLKLKQDMA